MLERFSMLLQGLHINCDTWKEKKEDEEEEEEEKTVQDFTPI